MFDLGLKKDFPIFNEPHSSGQSLVYLDSAATSQKPRVVIDAITDFYLKHNANIHRGIYELSMEVSRQYEAVRIQVADFIGSHSASQIIFTKNTTESLNLFAFGWGRANLGKGDVVLVTLLEHHASLLPWRELEREKGIVVKIIPILPDGAIDFIAYQALLAEGARVVAITAQSNVTGYITPLKDMIDLAHANGAKVVVDAAQYVGHSRINVAELDCDALAFSGHKMLGPTGVGVLYVKEDVLATMQPLLFGGGMVSNITKDEISYRDAPQKFEAGTPDIAAVIGLGSAIKYLESIGFEKITEHARDIGEYLIDALQAVQGVTLYIPDDKASRGDALSLSIDGIHAHDVATILDGEGVAVRVGHHCAQPLVEALGVAATVRISWYLYNTKEDIDRCVAALKKCQEVFSQK